jgi:PilZ domain
MLYHLSYRPFLWCVGIAFLSLTNRRPLYSFFLLRPIYGLMKDDRRSEPRIRSKGQITVIAEGDVRLSAEVFDISRSGISLLLARALHLGTRVEIDTGHLAAEGVVVHCAVQGDLHNVGIAFDPPAAA